MPSPRHISMARIPDIGQQSVASPKRHPKGPLIDTTRPRLVAWWGWRDRPHLALPTPVLWPVATRPATGRGVTSVASPRPPRYGRTANVDVEDGWLHSDDGRA
jgi:hypothetical protein